MPIKSYLAHPQEGKYKELLSELSEISNCDVIPSKNKELAIVVTDTTSDEQDEDLLNKINKIKSLQMLSLVSGFETN